MRMDLAPGRHLISAVLRASEIRLEGVQAYVPTRGVTRGLPALLERAEQGQLCALCNGSQFDPDHVRSPLELHRGLRLEFEHPAVHRRRLAAWEGEAKWRACGAVALDCGRKPPSEVL